MHRSAGCDAYSHVVQVVVVPRWGGSPDDDWYPWATRELRRDGVELAALALPHPVEPEIDAWVGSIAAALAGRPPSETVLVGHSVGCRAALRAAELLPRGASLGGLLLVAAWWEVDEPWDSLLPWQELEHDAGRVHAAAGRPVVLLSDDDPFTASWQQTRSTWIERLDADVRVVPGAKHFNAAEEHAVLEALRELVARTTAPG